MVIGIGFRLHVRMIDFGGQFCVFGVEERNRMMSAIRTSARKYSLANGLSPREIKGAQILSTTYYSSIQYDLLLRFDYDSLFNYSRCPVYLIQFRRVDNAPRHSLGS